MTALETIEMLRDIAKTNRQVIDMLDSVEINETVLAARNTLLEANKKMQLQVQTLFQEYVNDVQSKYKDAAILFRVGDFYECRGTFPKQVAEVLGITLTTVKGANDSSYYMCAFPHHALDYYLPKMVRGGLRVAIA